MSSTSRLRTSCSTSALGARAGLTPPRSPTRGSASTSDGSLGHSRAAATEYRIPPLKAKRRSKGAYVGRRRRGNNADYHSDRGRRTWRAHRRIADTISHAPKIRRRLRDRHSRLLHARGRTSDVFTLYPPRSHFAIVEEGPSSRAATQSSQALAQCGRADRCTRSPNATARLSRCTIICSTPACPRR